MRKNQTADDIALYNLQVLYDVESVLEKAIPKMINMVDNEQLRTGFEKHLGQTQVQRERLEEIFSSLDRRPRKMRGEGIRGLISDSKTILGMVTEESMVDMVLASAARQIEHYEISLYEIALTDARTLDQPKVAELLLQNLEEEKMMDKELAGWMNENPLIVTTQAI